jgi:glycosyltransferase involved in cell wall biosynthesis
MLGRAQAAYQDRTLDDEMVIIGYASGTPTHNRDFATVKPVIQELLRRYPQVELWLVGPLDPGRDWGNVATRIKHHAHVPWRKLPEILARYDINIAPLAADNPFSQSKSEIKYVEAGLVRVPTVATSTESFYFAIRHGENGCLAGNNSEWMEALATLIEHPELRRAFGEEAFQDVIQRYHPRVRSAELVTTLNQISQQFAARPTSVSAELKQSRKEATQAVERSFWIDPRVERNPTLFRRAVHSLRYRGLGTLLKQVRVYVRRWATPLFPYRTKKD